MVNLSPVNSSCDKFMASKLFVAEFKIIAFKNLMKRTKGLEKTDYNSI